MKISWTFCSFFIEIMKNRKQIFIVLKCSSYQTYAYLAYEKLSLKLRDSRRKFKTCVHIE